MKHCWMLLILACGAAQMNGRTALAERDRPSSPPRTTTVHWDRVRLGDAATRLSNVLGRAIVVDRRVDPNQRISLDASDAQAEVLVQQLAAAASLGASDWGNLSYLGPRSTAERLRTLAALREEDVSQLPDDVRAELRRKRPLDWPRLTEPRAIVAEVVQSRGWQLAGAERVPHDLWRAGRLPPLSCAEQLCVLLAGFDLTFTLNADSHTIELVPVTGEIALRRRYRLRGDMDAAQLRQLLPDAELVISDRTAEVTGTLEDHERLAAILGGKTAPAKSATGPRPARQVYTLRVQEQPVGVVLHELAERLGWTVDIDESAVRAQGLSLDKRVSFDVQNADPDELLDALLRPAGLTHRREENRVQVFPLGLRRD